MTHLKFYRNPANFHRYYRNQEENGCDYTPSANVQENEDNFKLEIAVPGYSKKDFRIDLEKDLLTISSEKEENKENENMTYTRREFGYGNFCRSFTLPETIDSENIKADYKNGILSITLPKKEDVKIKKEIRIA